jgi:hypothetical protein
VGENQYWQKEIVVRWDGLFKKITQLLKHRWQQDWVFILKTLFPQKQSNANFTNPTSTVGLQLLNLRLLKVMPRCINDGVTPITPGHQKTLNVHVILSDETSFTQSPTSGRVYIWKTPKEAYSLDCMPSSNSETQGRFYDGVGSNIVVFCWSHYYPSWLNYYKGVCEQVEQSGASHDPDIISEQRCSFPWQQCPHSHSWNCSVMVSRAWRLTSVSSMASTLTRYEHHLTTLVSFGD